MLDPYPEDGSRLDRALWLWLNAPIILMALLAAGAMGCINWIARKLR